MKRGEMLNKMLVLATNSHSGQYDKGGAPYILHPLKVMYYLKSGDEELQCIALGHDIVEDCGVTYEQLYIDFSQRVVSGIRALTKVPGESHREYMDKIKQHQDAIKVKLCDLRHNSDIRRLKGIGPKDIARMQKYHEMHLELKAALI